MDSVHSPGPAPGSDPNARPTVAGLVLAAGAGTRYGTPKALVRGEDGVPWLVRATRALGDAGCAPVIVVLGAGGVEAEALLAELGDAGPAGSPLVVHAADWADGLSASLTAGLRRAAGLRPRPLAVAVVPVDVPGLTSATVARVIGARPAGGAPATAALPAAVPAAVPVTVPVTAESLRQARFAGRPGHPVLIGRAHWAALIGLVSGDTGARPYLQAHAVLGVECGDLETGGDVDTVQL